MSITETARLAVDLYVKINQFDLNCCENRLVINQQMLMDVQNTLQAVFQAGLAAGRAFPYPKNPRKQKASHAKPVS